MGWTGDHWQSDVQRSGRADVRHDVGGGDGKSQDLKSLCG